MSPVTLLRALREYLGASELDPGGATVADLLDALEASVVERALNRGGR